MFTLTFKAHVATGSYSIAGYVKTPDLRSLLANSRAVSFFVSGRIGVGGMADLQGEIARQPGDPALSSVASANEAVSSALPAADGGAIR